MKKGLVYIFLMALYISSSAQTAVTITGKVFDAVSKEALQGASVTDAHKHTVATDATGKFSITTNDKTLTIDFNAFQSKTIQIIDKTNITVALTPTNKELEKVVVTANHTAQKRS